MSDWTECPHGELVDDAFACTPCAIGQGRAPRRLGDLLPQARADARFSGSCAGCDGWIAEGDPILLDEDGVWVCAEVCGL